MKTILYINDEHCTSIEQLKSYFSQLEVGSVFEDMLDYGRHGDITAWLQEKGYSEYAEGMKAIDSGLGDADFIKAMSKVLSGEESVAIEKKPYNECFSIEAVLIERKGDKAEVILSIMVHKGVNESYEMKVSSNWGTKGELFNPSEHEESKLVKKTIEYNRRAGKGEFGEVSVEVDGEKIDVKDDALKGNQTFTVKGVSFTMIAVEGGTFQMGATSEQGSDAYDDEKPVHSVTLSDYYIGETEVTQELWQVVMGSNPSYFKGSKRPVEQVSWNDCQTFIKKFIIRLIEPILLNHIIEFLLKSFMKRYKFLFAIFDSIDNCLTRDFFSPQFLKRFKLHFINFHLNAFLAAMSVTSTTITIKSF